MNHSQITSFIWSVADLIRDTFKRGKYQDVILPLTVPRRIDQVLEATRSFSANMRQCCGREGLPNQALRDH